jgi:uncharacterized membrane protein
VEETLQGIARAVATAVEIGAVVFIAIGAVEAVVITLPAAFLRRSRTVGVRREAYRRFGTWLMLALEFELGADIIRSAIAPNWNDIGQLAAIAVIRTFLNYFLERDLHAGREATPEELQKS